MVLLRLTLHLLYTVTPPEIVYSWGGIMYDWEGIQEGEAGISVEGLRTLS